MCSLHCVGDKFFSVFQSLGQVTIFQVICSLVWICIPWPVACHYQKGWKGSPFSDFCGNILILPAFRSSFSSDCLLEFFQFSFLFLQLFKGVFQVPQLFYGFPWYENGFSGLRQTPSFQVSRFFGFSGFSSLFRAFLPFPHISHIPSYQDNTTELYRDSYR